MLYQVNYNGVVSERKSDRLYTHAVVQVASGVVVAWCGRADLAIKEAARRTASGYYGQCVPVNTNLVEKSGVAKRVYSFSTWGKRFTKSERAYAQTTRIQFCVVVNCQDVFHREEQEFNGKLFPAEHIVREHFFAHWFETEGAAQRFINECVRKPQGEYQWHGARDKGYNDRELLQYAVGPVSVKE